MSFESLPDMVMLGYITYPVRAFVANPLRCFSCNVYGHVAAVCVCRREIPRCGKCAEGNGIEDCVVSVDKVVCVNCTSADVAGDQKCLVQEGQVEVARASSAEGVVVRPLKVAAYCSTACVVPQNSMACYLISANDWYH